MFVLIRECFVTWQTIKNDYNTTLVPITLYFLFASYEAEKLFLPKDIFLGLLYALLYIAPFCFSNQIQGIEEDRIEKPDRPLASGLISVRGAWYRFICWTLALLGWSFCFGMQKWSLMWVATTVFHNFLGGDNHFVTKNTLCMTLGTAAQFGAAWTTYHPRMCSLQRRWMWMIAIWIGILANIQDFRDMRGDRKRGRRTLPLVIGVLPARKLMALLCVLLGLILHSFLYRSSSILANSVRNSIFVWHLVLAVRIFSVRSTRGDQITYKYYLSFLYCFIVLCSFVFLKTLN